MIWSVGIVGGPSEASLLFVASSETDAPFCAEARGGAPSKAARATAKKNTPPRRNITSQDEKFDRITCSPRADSVYFVISAANVSPADQHKNLAQGRTIRPSSLSAGARPVKGPQSLGASPRPAGCIENSGKAPRTAGLTVALRPPARHFADSGADRCRAEGRAALHLNLPLVTRGSSRLTLSGTVCYVPAAFAFPAR